MDYSHVNNASGQWAKKDDLMKAGIKSATIVSETKPEPSAQYKNPKTGAPSMQDVAKVQFEGQEEAVKVSLNWQTMKALVHKFGADSKLWQGHPLGVEFEKYKDAQSVSRIKLYLVPEGYEVRDDSAGKTAVFPIGGDFDEPSVQVDAEDGDPGPDVPF